MNTDEFKAYKNYLESIKEKLTNSTYELADADWHYNLSDARCPHDAWLEELKVFEKAEGERNQIRSTEIFIRLFGAYHNGYIELTYKNVKSYSFAQPFSTKIEFENSAKTMDLNFESHGDWLYDRIELSENGYVLHKIEWASATEWAIECEDISYEWKPFDPNQTNNMEEAAKIEADKITYEKIHKGETGVYEQSCGFIGVAGSETVMFLNGLITNDVAKLEDNSWMLAAFPNAQGRLLAVVRVLRQYDKFLFITENETYEKVLQNLNRFTLAGDFQVNDSTEKMQLVSVRGSKSAEILGKVLDIDLAQLENNKILNVKFNGATLRIFHPIREKGFDIIAPKNQAKELQTKLFGNNSLFISEEIREILRLENGVPKYGVDMDETTIVPELGLENLISYNKGCYIGQEIIARIHFRGHVAKQLTGLIFEDRSVEIKPNDEIKSLEGKNAGRITSVTFSPKLEKTIALAFVRYDYLAEETVLKVNDFTAKVKTLPFVE